MDEENRCDNPASAEFDLLARYMGLELAGRADRWRCGKAAHGTNRIERVLGGCVIEENFSTDDSSLVGRSLSLHDERLGVWRQTWVDSLGAYLVFTGGVENGQMILTTEPLDRDGATVVNRMVFRDMEADSLNWVWQGSRDGGRSWTDHWNIEYGRR